MSDKLEIVVNRAIKKANDLRHEYLGLELLLWSLLQDKAVDEVIKHCEERPIEILTELEEYLSNPDNFSILSLEKVEEMSEQQFTDPELRKMAQQSGIFFQPELTVGIQRVFQRAAQHAQSSGKNIITALNLLVALFDENESFAIYVLTKRDINRLKVLQIISHGPDLSSENEQDEYSGQQPSGKPKRKDDVLEKYLINLTTLARQQKIDPLIGRSNELEQIIQILARRRKNNPLLVGEAGVGKTALAEGLALKIIEGSVPDILIDCEVYSMEIGSVIAGTKFRGDFEERLKSILEILADKNKDGMKAILFIDEMHMLMGAGNTGNSSIDAANLLKPYLSKGQLRCLASTTFEEYRKFVEKDRAFSRRFQKIDVNEPSVDETVKILIGLKSQFETYHHVTYSEDVIRHAVKMAERYITDKKFPDKAIDLIDEVGAKIRVKPPELRKIEVSIEDIDEIVSRVAHVPQENVKADEVEVLKKLEVNLNRLIYGQTDAVKTVVDSVLLSRAGLASKDKPQGVFLFVGPTGVGKTELAKQLAKELSIEFIRFDMSEYMEKHTVAKLIGAPPGYIGHDEGGLLTDALKKHPHAVVLLDEIEKAHTDIFNILLQVFDYGTLTDSHGRSSNFRNAFIIMTSNVGAKESEAGAIGLSPVQMKDSKREHALKNMFSPEFRNRLDSIVHFSKLNEEVVINIVEKFLFELNLSLSEKKIQVELSLEAKKWLAKVGLDPLMGARPIARTIDRIVKKPLSREILFGKFEDGAIIKVELENDELKFKF